MADESDKKGPVEKDGYYLCAKSGERVCSVGSPNRKLYCEECDTYYCTKHFKFDGRTRIAAGTDSEVEVYICPKNHPRFGRR